MKDLKKVSKSKISKSKLKSKTEARFYNIYDFNLLP